MHSIIYIMKRKRKKKGQKKEVKRKKRKRQKKEEKRKKRKRQKKEEKRKRKKQKQEVMIIVKLSMKHLIKIKCHPIMVMENSLHILKILRLLHFFAGYKSIISLQVLMKILLTFFIIPNSIQAM